MNLCFGVEESCFEGDLLELLFMDVNCYEMRFGGVYLLPGVFKSLFGLVALGPYENLVNLSRQWFYWSRSYTAFFCCYLNFSISLSIFSGLYLLLVYGDDSDLAFLDPWLLWIFFFYWLFSFFFIASFSWFFKEDDD